MSGRRSGRTLAALLWLPFAASAAPQVEQPRGYGHVIGDVLEQRVRLDDRQAPTLPPQEPAPQRITRWLERHPARIERAADGRAWLVVRYQVVNAPRRQTAAELPAWELAPGATVPAATLTLSPLLRDEGAEPSQAARQPERVPPPPDVIQPRRQTMLASGAAGAIALAWLLWRLVRQRRDARRPLERAWRHLRSLRDAARPRDWQVLHHALNATAGWTVQASDIGRLIHQRPWLAPLRDELETFFAASSARFFQRPDWASAVQADLCRLAQRLRDAERRASR
ncbi:calcium incorporation protein MxaA [Caldimonas sp. KR1-144]|uniref:calcium incorporation protein MxaA n=1 Tax=Caldimonas sp. KR1-144 TaxID=3400911 RepID=UPI003C094BD8